MLAEFCLLPFKMECVAAALVCVCTGRGGALTKGAGLPGLSHVASHVRFNGWLEPKQRGQQRLS